MSGTTSELSRLRWRVLVVASIGLFVASLDSSILAVALPTISADLQLNFSEALWVQTSYILIVTILLIPAGRWGEKWGLYRTYWLGVLLFGVFSVLVAFAFNGAFLIAGRVLQGIGGAMILATSAAIVTAAFPPQERGRALGLNMMAVTLGLTMGPPLGGFIVTHLGWPWIFLVKVPIALATLVMGWHLLGSERRDRLAASRDRGRPSVHIDVRGAALLGLFLVLLFVPLIFSPLWGWDDWRTIGLLLGSVVVGTLFVIVEDRTRDPILDLNMFRRSRVFTAANAGSLLYHAAAYGVTIFTAVFLVVAQGRSAQEAGLILLVQPLVMTIVTPVAGRLSDRYGSRGLSALGMVVTACAMLQLAFLSLSASTWQIVGALATLGLGLSIFSTPNFSAIMGSVGRSELGVASGLFATTRFAGMGVSIAILGAIAASHLGEEGGRVIFLGTNAGVTNALAFAAGYRQAMLVGAGIALIGALVSLVRERQPATATDPQSSEAT